MNLFIKKVIERNLEIKEIPAEHLEILQHWQEMIASKNLVKHKETAVVSSFISKFLETVLGYKTVGSRKNYTLAQEYPIASGAVDTALGEFFDDKKGDKIHAVFELKGAKAKNLDNFISGRTETPVQQAWRYARDVKGCQWILVTNYLEIRLYAFGETSLTYETFDLAKLTEPTEYAKFILCLHADNLLTGNTKALLEQSNQAEKDITAQLYEDYKQLRIELINGLTADNPTVTPLEMVSSSQKLLDRILFIAFAEDNGLLPAQSIKQAVEHVDLYETKPIYQNFKGLFNAVNKGRELLKIPAYNGGLFAPDKSLDKLIVSDELCKGFLKIAEYDFASEISVTVLGHIFEQSISDLEEITAQIQNGESLQQNAKTTSVSGKRKRHGIVYTPDHITAFIIQNTLIDYINQQFHALLTTFAKIQEDGVIDWCETQKPKKGKEHANELAFWRAWQDALKTIKVVDPACGSGAFLVAAFDVLQLEYTKVNERIADLTGHLSVFDLNKEILNSNLFGVDLNSESIEITKLSLWLKTAQRGKKLENIDNCLQVGNSLGFETPVIENGFCWQNHFSKILKSGGFDVVLGNPPYVRMELLTHLKPYLKEHYKVVSERADLYTYFFELGLKLLKPNGMLGFISSSTFFKTGSGEPLRNYLKHNATLKKVIDFGDLQVFEGVTTYPAILIFQNAKPAENSQIDMLILKDELPEDLNEAFKLKHGIMQHSQLKNESWQFEDARLSALREKLTRGFPTLKTVYGSPLYGIKTGLNEAFVIDGETKKRLISQDPKSVELLKPFLEGKDLKKWHAQPRDLWLIFVPWHFPLHKDSSIVGASEKAEQEFETQYPAIYEHLTKFKKALSARNQAEMGIRYEWYALQRYAASYYEEFEKPKIQYGHFSSNPLFHFNSTCHYSNDKSYIIPTADQFLLGLLNSKITWFLLISLCPFVRGGFYELRSQYVETLPIPPATDEQKTKIGDLAKECQTLSEARYQIENDTRLTISTLGTFKFSQKLEKWWLLEFADFLSELKKAKIEIELKKQNEWRNFFDDAKMEREKIDLQIRLLEKELNVEIYELFDLTSEEILLIENQK